MYEASRGSQLINLLYSTVALSSSGYRTGTSAVGDSVPLSFATVTPYQSIDLLGALQTVIQNRESARWFLLIQQLIVWLVRATWGRMTHLFPPAI